MDPTITSNDDGSIDLKIHFSTPAQAETFHYTSLAAAMANHLTDNQARETERKRDALIASIGHWSRLLSIAAISNNVRDDIDEEGGTAHDACALCQEYYYSRQCQGCPVYEDTGERTCHGSPYYAAERSLRPLRVGNISVETRAKAVQAVHKQVAYLTGLLAATLPQDEKADE